MALNLSPEDLAAFAEASKKAAADGIAEYFTAFESVMGEVSELTAQGGVDLSPDAIAAIGAEIARQLAKADQVAAVSPQGNPIAARHPKIQALIQTPLSQQLMPGEYLLVNMQINGAEKLADADYWRVRLNTGCGPQGELDGQPAAHRGFETADTPAESLRLARATSTSRCYNVVKVGDRYLLDESAPLIDAAGIERIKAHPKVHAVRVANWEALDEWVRWTASGRPNKAD